MPKASRINISMMNHLKIIISIVISASLISCAKDKNEENGYSKRLEDSKGIMKIRLGSPISNYPGFNELPDAPVWFAHGGKTWGYTAKNSKYSKVGDFDVRNYTYEKMVTEDFDKFISPAQQATEPELFLLIYTYHDTICSIQVQVSNRADSQNKNFHYYLADAYGPTLGSKDNPNDVALNIRDGNKISWESENVTLDSQILFVNRYHKGRVMNFDTYCVLTYWWKPMVDRLNVIKDAKDAEKKKSLEEPL